MTLKVTLLVLNFVIVMKFTKTDMSGFIIGGQYSRIQDFPHSVFLHIYCSRVDSVCGASILNQAVLLTAAHCIARCRRNFEITAFTGSVRKYKGTERVVISFKVHENYDEVEVSNDIALLLVKDLVFGRNVKRVVLMRTPPKSRFGVIAGWGAVDHFDTETNVLKHTKQKILSNRTCHRIVKYVPPGTFCGQDSSYPDSGDSGNALITYKFIQVGIVSFKIRPYSNETLVYTNVAYFYYWIMHHAAILYCQKRSILLKERMKERKWTERRKLIGKTYS